MSKTNAWSSLMSRNLSSNSNEFFKLIQFLKTSDNTILFDLREFHKGKPTEVGFSLVLSEYKWFKRTLISNDKSTHILEHNNRVLTIDKELEDYLITVTKSNGKVKRVVVTLLEIVNLITAFEEMENVLLNNKTLIKHINFEAKDNEFFRVTIK